MPKRRFPSKDFIWTPELAYAVGLLVTDGCLYKNGRHINLTSKDKDQIETFLQCLNLHNHIGLKSRDREKLPKYFQVQIGDVQFYDWLLKIGLMPAKSRTIGSIAIPDKFFADYFRGCIDGDGNIQTYRDGYNTYKGRRYITQRLFIRIVSASERHIIWLYNRIKTLTGISGFIAHRNPISEKHSSLWELKFAKKKSLCLIEWMYYSPGVPCLKRKRNNAEEAVAIIKQQKRKKYTVIKIT